MARIISNDPLAHMLGSAGEQSPRQVGDRLLYVRSEAQSLFWFDVFIKVLADLCEQEMYLFSFADS